MNAPIELPTTRQSRHFHQGVNIHDPSWIPVLNKTSPKSQASTPYHDNVPRYPSRGSSRPGTAREGDGEGEGTPRSFSHELDAGPVGRTRSRQGVRDPHNRQRTSRETEDTLTSSGDDTILSADAPSTAGTRSLLENQTYILPRTALSDSRSPPPSAGLSDTESAVLNMKRPAVPTSRFNRKPGMTGSNPSSPTTASPVYSMARADSPRSVVSDATQSRKMSSPSIHDLSLQQSKPTSPISLFTTTHTSDLSKKASQRVASPPYPARQLPTAVQELSGDSYSKVPSRSTTAVELPTTLPQLPPEPPSIEPSYVKNRKSTASIRTTVSVRKKRALHSHPSNPSIRSEKLEAKAEPAVTPTASPGEGVRRNRTNESRRSVATDSAPPTIAPSGPLPDLPPKAVTKRPSTRQRMHKVSDGNLSLFPQQPSVSQTPAVTSSPPKVEVMENSRPKLYYSPSSFSLVNNNENAEQLTQHQSRSEANLIPHKELAEFMTSKSTLIFRRFDEMHVKLLLSIQDEIAALERELLALEATTQPQSSSESTDEYDEDEDEQIKGGVLRRKSTKQARSRSRSRRSVKDGCDGSRELKTEQRKFKIMADLRRLMAEYDHLYSNWTAMQKTPATLRDRRDLERFLSGDVTTSETARSDLLWVENHADDLSSVNVVASPSAADTSRPSSRSKAAAEWGKNKGKLAAKGLGLKMKSDSPLVNAGNNNNNNNNLHLDEKNDPSTSDQRAKASLFGSLFGGCAGRRN